MIGESGNQPYPQRDQYCDRSQAALMEMRAQPLFSKRMQVDCRSEDTHAPVIPRNRQAEYRQMLKMQRLRTGEYDGKNDCRKVG